MINRTIHQIWIGPLPPPKKWMNTWKKLNPDWEYVLWDNEKVFSRKWKNQHIIDYYLDLYENQIKGKGPNGQDMFTKANGGKILGEKATLFAWHVIADIIRYEVLLEYGGYMPGADSVCLRNIDDKFPDWVEVYTLRTGNLHEAKYYRTMAKLQLHAKGYGGFRAGSKEAIQVQRLHPDNASPILAAQKGNIFMGHIVEELSRLSVDELGEAVDTTGNVFMGKMIRKYRPEKMLMPDYTVRADRIANNDYSMHWAGTTKNTYNKGRYANQSKRLDDKWQSKSKS